MPRVDETIDATVRRLADAGIENPRLDARLLLQEATGLEAEDVAREPSQILTEGSLQKLCAGVRRRQRREPISRIVGRREFWSLDFAINAEVLDPRPDTETLIDALLAAEPDRSKPITIADLGTGSGCLLCAALSEFSNAYGIGMDRSATAIDVAKENARVLGLSGRAEFIRGQWASTIAAQSIDVILTNPPYIPSGQIMGLDPEVAKFDPHMALDGGEDGLDAYRAIARDIERVIKPGGKSFVEIGPGQAEAVASLFESDWIERIEEIPDLSGQLRCLKLDYKKKRD